MPERRLDNAGLLMKKIFLKICIYATIICVLVSVFAAPAFATGDVVQFTEAAKLGATVIDLYGMANNTSLAYDVASTGSALTVIENLYQDYATNASDPYTLAAIGAALAAAGAVAVVYDAVTGQGYIQLYQEQYVSSMDGYWDYQLADAGLVRDSLTGLFNWSLNQQDSVSPISLYTSIPVFPNQPFQYYSHSTSANRNTFLSSIRLISYSNYNTWDGYYGVFPLNPPANVYYFSCLSDDGTKYQAVVVSDNDLNNVGFQSDIYYYRDWTYTPTYYNALIQYQSSGLYYRVLSSLAYTANGTFYSDVPYYSSFSSAIAAILPYFNGTVNPDSIVIEPTVITGDPLTQPLEITIPDNADPNYEPAPRRITTNIPWDPAWGNPLPDGVSEPEYGVPYPITDPALLNTVVPEIWDDIVANDVQTQPDPTPSDPDSPVEEVMVPFLPLEIPSFNFSLSGIWHYVVTWVQSLGSWFTAMFAMWSCLPYAMVVPVYATLVVVIVLGLYKRFIA